MGNLETKSAPKGKRLGAVGGTLSRRSGGTLRKSSFDPSSVPEATHKFSLAELEWLNTFFLTRFGKSPTFADLCKTFPWFSEHESLLQELFRVLDRNKNSVLDFDEFVYGCSVCARGSLDQKMAFLFLLMDRDEDRIVTRLDAEEMIRSIGRYMVRDGPLCARLYNPKDVSEVFRESETLLLDRFRQRAASSDTMDNCMRFADSIFQPLVSVMEVELGSAQLFGRPLQYLAWREEGVTPMVLTSLARAIAQDLQNKPLDPLVLFAKGADDAAVLQAAKKIEGSWIDDPKAPVRLEHTVAEVGDATVLAGVLKKFLLDLPEPLFPFVVYSDFASFDPNKGGLPALQNLVKQFPTVHLASFRCLMGFMANICNLASDKQLFAERLCVVLAPLVNRPKKQEEKDQWAKSVRNTSRALLLILTNDALPPVESDKAAFAELNMKLRESRDKVEALRAEIIELNNMVANLKQENSTQAEKISQHAETSWKLSQRIADLRQELTQVKMEKEIVHTPKAESESVPESPLSTERDNMSERDMGSSVVKAVAEWLEGGPVEASESDTLEKIARKEIEAKRKKVTIRPEREKDAFSNITESAPDPVTIVVELIKLKGLLSKDGRCDAFPKVSLLRYGEDKVLRKKVGQVVQQKSTDPVWNLKFSFVVSAALLEEFIIKVAVYHADKFGRNSFLGVVHVPLQDVMSENLEDWFPFKQNKPTDKVSGELFMRVSNSMNKVAEKPASAAVEFYEASKSIHRSNPDLIMALTSKVQRSHIQSLYVGELPNNASFIVYDEAQRSVGGSALITAVRRDKFFEVLTNLPRVQKDPEFMLDALLTMDTWTKPDDFLMNVLSRFMGPSRDSPLFEKYEQQAKATQEAAVKVVYEWINNPLMNQEFFRIPGLKESVLASGAECGFPVKSLNMQAKQSAVGQRMRSGSIVDMKKTGTRARREESVFELPVTTVAEQLSLIEFSLLSEIRLQELAGQAWNKDGKEERARNVLAYISWFNRMSKWIATQIIQQAGALERAAAISRFIEIGTALASINNFNGVIEILSALHSSPISRLKETWSLVPKEAMAQLEQLDVLMNTEGNFKYYRNMLEKSKPPVVPYLGLLLTDLTFVDDANLTEVGSTGGKLLNMEKLRMLAGVYRVFRKCLTKPYAFSEIRSMRRLLMHVEGFDDNELYRLSKLREQGQNSSIPHLTNQTVRSTRKLLTQITANMHARTKLEVDKDMMSKEDWDSLLGMEGVTQTTFKQGDVIIRCKEATPNMYLVKSGTVNMLNQEAAGNTPVLILQEGDIFGVLSVLDANKPTFLEASVASATCEVWVIPSSVVQNFCQDVDLSRHFYGTVAQSQVKALADVNKVPLKRKARSVVGMDSVSWDVTWSSKGSFNQKDVNFLGVLALSKSELGFSSRMLGFLTKESTPLVNIVSVVLQGNMGKITLKDHGANTLEWAFKCVSGASETEQCVVRINDALGQVKRSVQSEDDVGLAVVMEASNNRKEATALSKEDWEALTQGAKRVVVHRDEVVMKEGESYQRMYQVVRGAVRVEKVINGELKVLSRMGASETFGDMSFLTGSPASATCLADTDECELTIIEGYYVNMLFSMRPDLAGRFYKFLSMLLVARIAEKVEM